MYELQNLFENILQLKKNALPLQRQIKNKR